MNMKQFLIAIIFIGQSIIFLEAGITSPVINMSAGLTMACDDEFIGSKEVNLSAGQEFTGNGLIKSPKIEIRTKKFTFTGTINCSGTCTIRAEEPFDATMFKRIGGGEFKIIIEPFKNDDSDSMEQHIRDITKKYPKPHFPQPHNETPRWKQPQAECEKELEQNKQSEQARIAREEEQCKRDEEWRKRDEEREKAKLEREEAHRKQDEERLKREEERKRIQEEQEHTRLEREHRREKEKLERAVQQKQMQEKEELEHKKREEERYFCGIQKELILPLCIVAILTATDIYQRITRAA